MVVDLVMAVFREGQMAEEYMRQAVVLIPKRKGDHRGIGLAEVEWKVVVAILNRHITASIDYHYFLHGFREYCSTGTATFKANCFSS